MNALRTAVVIRANYLAVLLVIGLLGVVNNASAHCDTMNGPIIPEAQAALENGEVVSILKWVKEGEEAEVRSVFDKAFAVRAKGPEEKELADRYFLETLVRLHRASEGAPYSGLKDQPIEPIVAMADKALVEGSVDDLLEKISEHMAEAIREKHAKALEKSKSKDESVEAGREFVDSYVAYMHYVEAIHATIMSAGSDHGEAAGDGMQKVEQMEHGH